MQALIIPSEADKIKSWIHFACQSNGVSALAPKIVFRFRKRFTRILGQAFAQRKLLEFSAPLWARASESERKQVVIHEACHIIAYFKYGYDIKPHGREWKMCMEEAGAMPLRCHSVNRNGLKRQYVKYEVSCECVTVWIGHVRAAQVREGKLACKRCKVKLKLTGKVYKPNSKQTRFVNA